MQDFQPITGLSGRLFGVEPADLRRPAPRPEEVRCPRCESTNTKFCYYNNYNLSQPRHFCKSCRRYWTKGGLLRNVPVGGGCRRPKRPSSSASVSVSGPASTDAKNTHRDAKSSRPSCTGSWSPTAAAAAATAAATVDGLVSQSAAVITHSSSPLAPGIMPSPAPLFADQAAAFASLFAPLPAPPPSLSLPAFGFSEQQSKAEGLASVFPDQPSPAATIAVNMTPFAVRSGGGMIAGTDWQPASVDAGMFELTGAVGGDVSFPAQYWNPASWTEPDPTIYLP